MAIGTCNMALDVLRDPELNWQAYCTRAKVSRPAAPPHPAVGNQRTKARDQRSQSLHAHSLCSVRWLCERRKEAPPLQHPFYHPGKVRLPGLKSGLPSTTVGLGASHLPLQTSVPKSGRAR